MYIDDYGNEFETMKEVRDYAIQNLYKDDEDFVNTLKYLVTCTELLNWIIKNPTVFEEFKKDYVAVIKTAENSYTKEYLDLYCEKVKD